MPDHLTLCNPPSSQNLEVLNAWINQPNKDGRTAVLCVRPEYMAGDPLVIRSHVEDTFVACLDEGEYYRVKFEWMSLEELDDLHEFDGF